MIAGFGPLMDVDKLIPIVALSLMISGFGPLMDVDKLILTTRSPLARCVLGL